MNIKFIKEFHRIEKVNHIDIFRQINDSLGFGVASGDTIEIKKVVNKYDGKGGGKVIVPPTHLVVDHVTPTFIYFSDDTYIYNDESTYIIIPTSIKNVLDTGDKTIKLVKDTTNKIVDSGSNIFSGLESLLGNAKWVAIAVALIIGLVLIRKLTD
jgi:hypothetical protein